VNSEMNEWTKAFDSTRLIAGDLARLTSICTEWALLILISVVIMLPLSGCSSTEHDDPIAAMTDTKLATWEQIEAMEQAAEREPDNPERIKTLKSIMTSPGNSIKLRLAAYELLMAHDPADTRFTLQMRLPSITAWDFRTYVCERAVEEGWTEFTPALVRALAQHVPTTPLDERPEYLALVALNPDRDLREVVFDTIVDPGESIVYQNWRMSAWELFQQLGDLDPLFDLFEKQAGPFEDDPFLEEMRIGAVELGVLPRTKEEVKWLQKLRQPEHREYWERCREIAKLVSKEHQGDVQLRHLAVVAEVGEQYPDWLNLNVNELYYDLENSLKGREYFSPTSSMDDSDSDPTSERLRHWPREDLLWSDLLAIKFADTIVRQPEVKKAIFEQVALDREDTSTEFGGILDWPPTGPEALLYYPRYRENDRKFYASNTMVDRGYTAPFHYHFHVQDIKNHRYAGPGSGDMRYAAAMGINGLVFSSVDRDRLNVDFYSSEGIVVDLGVITP
jgi:hypothetical protein